MSTQRRKRLTKDEIVTRLRKLGVFNTYQLLRKYAIRWNPCIAVTYETGTHFSPAKCYSWSPLLADDASKYTFVGKKSSSLPKALDWVGQKYGVEAWVTCPFHSSTKIPKNIYDKAVAAAEAVVL